MSRRYGVERDPAWHVWRGIIYRTENPKCRSYKRYGGRGIRMCARWRASFEAFTADMGPRPSMKHQIDRIDNEGHYEPGNCRWVTVRENNYNRRNNRRITLGGVEMTMTEWCTKLGLNPGTFAARIRRGWTLEEAFGPPTFDPKGGPHKGMAAIEAALAEVDAGARPCDAAARIGVHKDTLRYWRKRLRPRKAS